MKIKPYGDTSNDGKVQVSFTLPLPLSEYAHEAAIQYATKMGMMNPSIVHSEDIKEGFSFFIVYGQVKHYIDTDEIHIVEEMEEVHSKDEVEQIIANHFNRDLIFVGASTGSDAHTVGIDAIMNMKGFAGHYGLERYKGIEGHNLGSQVTNEEFIRYAKKVKADVLLVSQTVTQKDVHIKNLIELVELLEAEKMRDDVILVVGGARITMSLAKELGYDAGFGPKKYAEDVAYFAVHRLIEKKRQ